MKTTKNIVALGKLPSAEIRQRIDLTREELDHLKKALALAVTLERADQARRKRTRTASVAEVG